MRNGIVIGLAMAIPLALIVAALVYFDTSLSGPPPLKTAAHAARSGPVSSTPPPPIEPIVLRDITPERARIINAAIPFANGPHPTAAPFVLAASPQDRERALYCLTSAAWYEAGNDPVGQRAVIQVVLNRMRHPAYPKTICGVVFQGAERATGCQFTFTCDGALARVPPPPLWAKARAISEDALRGAVFAKVGMATSYHTDWVVPYWSSALEKIAEVNTHLFFRWPGSWGTPSAFTGRYAGGEHIIVRPDLLAALPPGMSADPAGSDPMALTTSNASAAGLRGSAARAVGLADAEFALALDPAAVAASYQSMARRLCRDQPACIVAGWINPDRVPSQMPIPKAALRTASFLYRKSARGIEQAHWNCRQLRGANPRHCMPGTERTEGDS